MISAHARFSEGVALCREHGFGRIEVANAPMIGITRFFARNDVRGALADALAAAEAACRVSHRRGEMVAHMISAETHANLGALAEAKAQIAEVEALTQRLGAKRFAPLYLNCHAKVLRAEGREEEAVAMEGEKNQFVFDDLASRVERYPNDLHLRFELGKQYFTYGYYDDALTHLQLAQKSPKDRLWALYYLAMCFLSQGQNDMGVMQLETARAKRAGNSSRRTTHGSVPC